MNFSVLLRRLVRTPQ